MSEVAAQARRIAGRLLPTERRTEPPPLVDVETALTELRALHPADAFDEVALHEAGETVLRLREAARFRRQAN